MAGFFDWFGPALAAAFFLTLGGLKLHGLRCGYVGGRDKPLFEYACGTCPAWRSRTAHLVLLVVLFGVGLLNFGLAIRAILAS